MPQENTAMILVPVNEMQERFVSILLNEGFTQDKALQCAAIFVDNSVDGISTHGVNRFPRFIEYIRKGYIDITAEPSLQSKFGGIEQWNGHLGPGILNAVFATDIVMKLATHHGIGCVGLNNTNHWMRGGTYGWQAAKAGYVFIGWTNTIANMPAWGAKDPRLGNNPLVIGLPYNEEAIVLDMAMSQYSFGSMELSAMKREKLSVYAGFDNDGILTNDPSAVLVSRRPLPAGYWKGAGLALLMDLLATVLSGGLATHEISKREIEFGMSQVFIAIDLSKLGNRSAIAATIQNIISDYHQSVLATEPGRILYPGERVLETRKINLAKGIPVIKGLWDKIIQL